MYLVPPIHIIPQAKIIALNLFHIIFNDNNKDCCNNFNITIMTILICFSVKIIKTMDKDDLSII